MRSSSACPHYTALEEAQSDSQHTCSRGVRTANAHAHRTRARAQGANSARPCRARARAQGANSAHKEAQALAG